jgi:hypothetical protein
LKIEINTSSTKRTVFIAIIGSFLSVGLGLYFEIQKLVLLILPFMAVVIYLLQKFAKSKSIVQIEEPNFFVIDNEKINCSKIAGYFIFENGFSETICIKVDSRKPIELTGLVTGKKGKVFKENKLNILTHIKNANPQFSELEYQDVYEKQVKNLRPLIYIIVGLVIIIDILFIGLWLTNKINLPYQLFIANSMLFILKPMIKKKKQN